jgi:hypothetical protein
MPRPTFPVYRYNRRSELIWPLEENTFQQDYLRPPPGLKFPVERRKSPASRPESPVSRGKEPQQRSFLVNTDIGPSFAGFGNTFRVSCTEVEDDTEAAAQQDESMSTRDYRTPSTSLGVDAQPENTTARAYLSLPFMDEEYDSDEDYDSDEEIGSEHIEDVSMYSLPQPSSPQLSPRSPLQVQLSPPPYSPPLPPKNPRRQSVHSDMGRPSIAALHEEDDTEPESMDWELTTPETTMVNLTSRFPESYIRTQNAPNNHRLSLERRLARGDSGKRENITMSDASQNGGPARVS